jgi:hypothetical protein
VPEVLLLDEPTAHLDPQDARMVEALLSDTGAASRSCSPLTCLVFSAVVFPATENDEGLWTVCETAFWFGGGFASACGRVLCVHRRVTVHTLTLAVPRPAPSSSRVAARTGPELEMVANHGLCLMRQILWTMTPAGAEIRVTCARHAIVNSRSTAS